MYEQHSMKSMKTERSVTMTMKVSNMKCGWYQIINDTAHYYQTPCNIALIVEQLSSYNSVLRQQIKTEEDAFLQLKHKIRDENMH